MKGSVSGVDLDTGKLFDTELPGDVVAVSPDQKYLYSIIKASDDNPDINIFSQPTKAIRRMPQTTLVKGYIVPDGALLAEMRENVATYAHDLVISPDGYWVTVPGSMGWHSLNCPKREGIDDMGYGMPVFSTANLRTVQQYLRADYSPLGFAFNLVTGQTAIVCENKGIRIADLADPSMRSLINGSFSGPLAWSGKGNYLLAARDMRRHVLMPTVQIQNGRTVVTSPQQQEQPKTNPSSLQLYANELSANELQVAASWWKALPVPGAMPAAAPAGPVSEPVAEIAKFDAALDLAGARQLLERAMKNGHTRIPLNWSTYRAYQLTPELADILKDAATTLDNAEARGIMIFQLREWLKVKEHTSLPAQYYLTEALRRSGQLQDATPFLQIIHEDAGKTDLSCLALNGLANVYLANHQDQQALACLAGSLLVDRLNPDTHKLLVPVMERLRMTDLIAPLNPAKTVLVSSKLPVLPLPSRKTTPYQPAELYAQTVASVVLIKTDAGSGSGFCVGQPDIILTNNHVIGNQLTAKVQLYINQDGKPKQAEVVTADVLYQSPEEDVAILQLRATQTKLTPLFVAASTPKVGERVFAIGNPGLGEQILEHSITEGLISADNRKINDKSFVQLSVPVNPGNSGGPLLDEFGQVVGIVTLSTELENVNFAIPVERIRALFPKDK